MFWPATLPFLITAITFAILCGSLQFVRFHSEDDRRIVFRFTLALMILIFIPTCSGVMLVLNEYRFGIFSYKDYNAVNDYRIEQHLPEAAKNIVMSKEINGLRARFEITQKDLDAFLDKTWAKNGRDSIISREAPKLTSSDVYAFAK